MNNSYYNKDVYNDLEPINKCTYFNEWFKIVEPILLNDEFQRRKLFLHHENSVWEHSIIVSFKSFLVLNTIIPTWAGTCSFHHSIGLLL